MKKIVYRKTFHQKRLSIPVLVFVYTIVNSTYYSNNASPSPFHTENVENGINSIKSSPSRPS